MYGRSFCDNSHSDNQNSVLYNDVLLNDVNMHAGSDDSVRGELQPLSSHSASPGLYSLSQYPPRTHAHINMGKRTSLRLDENMSGYH